MQKITMENQLRLEEAAMFALSILLFMFTAFNWWWYPVLLLVPDVSMLGYLAGPKSGAMLYNFFHHKATGILLIIIGTLTGQHWINLAGIILFGHASMDRILGYGLKYADSFHHTHLGWIKKPAK